MARLGRREASSEPRNETQSVFGHSIIRGLSCDDLCRLGAAMTTPRRAPCRLRRSRTFAPRLVIDVDEILAAYRECVFDARVAVGIDRWMEVGEFFLAFSNENQVKLLVVNDVEVLHHRRVCPVDHQAK